ncbi:MAG: acyl-CoA dehydrogenase family protein [Myxococcota bacterium]
MNFAFSEEQEAFREVLRRFGDERWSLAEVRRGLDTPEGFDRGAWKQLSEELGLPGLILPEEVGGQGFGFLELGIAFEELGRQLAGGPLLATVCASLAILNAGSPDDRQRWLPSIASGETIASLAWLEGRPGAKAGEVPHLRRDGERWRVSGRRLALDGASADLLVVPAKLAEGEGISLLVIPSDAPGVRTLPVEPFDLSRRLAEVDFDEAPGHLLGEEGQAEAAFDRSLDQANLAVCAEMVGGAARCLEMAVEYAKTRVQFARPIGSFQAIQHKTAEMLLELETARSAAYWAWWVAGEADGDLAEAASLAKSCCADAFDRAARENLQIHGGLGFTWEHDAHLFYRRARADDTLFGDAPSHRARLATHLGL